MIMLPGDPPRFVTQTQLNEIKLVLIDSGDFPFLESPNKLERHLETDELFMVLSGLLHVGLTPDPDQALTWHSFAPGQGIVVPKAGWHATYVTGHTLYLLGEKQGTGENNTQTASAWKPGGMIDAKATLGR